MNIYARIEGGRVVEIIAPLTYEIDAPLPPDDDLEAENWPTFKAGELVPIEKRFTAEIVATLVDVSDLPTVGIGDTYVNGIFAPYVPPVPSAAEIQAMNAATRDSLLATATARIAPLQDAEDLGVSTSQEQAALLAWKKYRVDVNRVVLSEHNPAWPALPN